MYLSKFFIFFGRHKFIERLSIFHDNPLMTAVNNYIVGWSFFFFLVILSATTYNSSSA